MLNSGHGYTKTCVNYGLLWDFHCSVIYTRIDLSPWPCYIMESFYLHYRIILVSPHLFGMSIDSTCMHTYLLESTQCLCICEWISTIPWFLCTCISCYCTNHTTAMSYPALCVPISHAAGIYIYIYISLLPWFMIISYGSDCYYSLTTTYCTATAITTAIATIWTLRYICLYIYKREI